MRIARRALKKGRIELIPLIDTILMLLIFYMTFGKLVKDELKLDAVLPIIQESAADTDAFTAMNVEVVGKGKLIVNDEEQDLSVFAGTLEGLSLVADTVSVSIKGRDSVFYQEVIDVLNLCAKSGIKNISFVSE
ncbi:MAG: hypothetical protein A2452_00840 [Candidatus Firestonebacteria bacterium RIFOXYC2_FULL_39_67]|nr:MAG: hypothetical protein A2536_10800 [Candidatus Firestonebacteria bacterium RIFOXYD2_FULL_39_29]OGF53404.1 MAG: hypothetical protein A2497_03285 [Candidatus Firestonebacteria bacterium RifOxyC12_full_39_7]OGF54746.1 MAG: hypothetical protein A2452_00840 [Candidatus Firestonebacteria bacterium RIFOXYC2_FULL_39_67]